ncbi:ABC transporter substrate-binding protein [Rhodoligotrophos defluvii]|uniref:ABC transporter substrate-binding protein n=1 Tax=Rhodoligotrophos defluvii TaxID=2561934 RepID=UPI0010C95240|nr:spermidine/putrescine ABC transporter substrate-binding protein [Rhodoligotrophos defluvii]
MDFRRFMSMKPTRRQVLSGATAFGAAALSGFNPRLAEAQSDDKVLSWLTYPGHGAPEVVKPFEDKYGVKIVAKEYSGGERLLALIHGSPPGTFDVVLSDEAYVNELKQAGFIEPMNPADYPIEDFWPDFQKFPLHWIDDQLYTVMTSWGINGLAYNADKLTAKDVESYAIMWDERIKGKVGMRDWYLPCMGCISAYLGNKKPYDLTDEQFEKLKETIFSLKPQVAGFWDFAGVFDSFANGGAMVVPGTGEWMVGLLQRDGHNIRAAVPKEGAIIWTESASIVKGTKKEELAKEFIRYLVSPEGQRRLMLKSSYMASGPSKVAWELLNKENPKEAKMINMDLNAHNLMDDYRAGLILLRELPSNQSSEEWQDVWTEFQNM